MIKYFLEKTPLLGRSITISNSWDNAGTFLFKYCYCGHFNKSMFREENPLKGIELKTKEVR